MLSHNVSYPGQIFLSFFVTLKQGMGYFLLPVVLSLGVFGKGLTTPRHNKPVCYETLRRTFEAASCEHGNEISGSIKGGEFLDWLSEC
jgi:hypothetical protein